MNTLSSLTQEVADARLRYLDVARTFSPEQGLFKPAPPVWSAAEITEHLVYAEYGGINGIAKALHAIRLNAPIWTGDNENHGLSIEQVIARTWKPKEDVPAGAGPRMGGPLGFWMNALESCQLLVERIADDLTGEDLEAVICPHPISGPLDARQRFQFLRFHIDRHRMQIEELRRHPGFPPDPQ